MRVVAIDMCTVFKAAVRESLPHAVLVVDRFHVAQLAHAVLPLLAGRRAELTIDRARLASAEQTRLALGLFRLTVEPAPGKELRIFRLQRELLERHHGLWTEVTGRLWRAQLRGTAIQTGGQLLFAAGYLGGVLLVVRDAIAGRRTVGDVILSITLAAQVNQ